MPIVSIGNITLGGTGKTPFVEFICRWYLSRGKQIAILSRGYGAGAGPNDEARVLAQNVPDAPHLQGKDRVALAHHATDTLQPDVLVLDDGFQHRWLARDLDVVLIDCTRPFGYGRLFPRGLLREPIASLRRADIVVLSRARLCSSDALENIRRQIADVAGDKPFLLADQQPTGFRNQHGEPITISMTTGRRVAAFCGIGSPEAFRQTLVRLGIDVIATQWFPDHHAYAAADVDDLSAWVTQLRPDFVVTTQKDLVKIPRSELGGFPLMALQIECVVEDPESHLDRALSRLLIPRTKLERSA